MEQNAIQWLGAPCCLRGSFAFYKSFSWRAEEGHRAAVWRLGEFYFVRCAPQEPVCIAELTLLWEDREQRHQLVSSRLYFLPEDTPEGRIGDHGEDEVLAVSKKVVIRVEDLVKWACPEPAGWKAGNGSFTDRKTPNGQLVSPSMLGPHGDKGVAESPEQRRIKVLSYPQYCRFRSLQRRVQDRASGPTPVDPHLLALGGIRAAPRNTLVLYCRDTFNHPTLDSNASIWTRLGCSSLSLKGRPRKRRGRDGKGFESQSCNQAVASWMDKMKESVMGSVELPLEAGWLPHREEQHFLDQLYLFMESRGSPIHKVPNLGFKKIDLFLLFSTVKRLGGYEKVTEQRLWKQVYNELGGSPGSTSAATCTRRHYEKLMLAYEQHLNGGGAEKPGPQRTAAPCRSGEVQNVRKTASDAACQEGRVRTKAADVRRRGRPPNKRLVRATVTSSPRQSTVSAPKAPSPRPHDTPSQPQSAQALSPAPGHQDAMASGRALGIQPTSVAATPPFQATAELGVKVEHGEPIHLAPGVALGPLCLPKGLYPLKLFTAHLGLGGEERPGSAPQQAGSNLPPSVLFIQATAGTDLENGLGCGPPGEGLTDARDPVGACDCRSRSTLPPLRIIPLDIDCSLQVRKLMRTRVDPTELSSFTRKLSEVLAQDLSKTRRPGSPPSGTLEQPLPLNLSKRAAAESQRPDGVAKRMKPDWAGLGDSGPGLMTVPATLGQLTQEEPADLSSPRRVRASAQEWAGHTGAARGAEDPESSLGTEGRVEHVNSDNDAVDLRGRRSDQETKGRLDADPETAPLDQCGRPDPHLDRVCWPLPGRACVDTHVARQHH